MYTAANMNGDILLKPAISECKVCHRALDYRRCTHTVKVVDMNITKPGN